MGTQEEFKTVWAGVASELQTELYSLITTDPETSFQRMVDIAAENR